MSKEAFRIHCEIESLGEAIKDLKQELNYRTKWLVITMFVMFISCLVVAIGK